MYEPEIRALLGTAAHLCDVVVLRYLHGTRISGLQWMVQDLWSGVQDLELGGEPERLRVAGCGFRADGVGFRVQGLGLKIDGVGFRVLG